VKLDKTVGGSFGEIMKPKTYVVMGMHRTGTTFLTQCLERSGVAMGGSKDKYRENPAFSLINRTILNAAGGGWESGVVPLPLENVLKQQGKFDDRIKATIAHHKKHLWGFKDPRTALTIRLLMPHILEVDDDPFLYCCFRRPEKIADSLNRRQGTPQDFGLVIAKEYNTRLLNFLWDFCGLEK